MTVSVPSAYRYAYPGSLSVPPREDPLRGLFFPGYAGFIEKMIG